MDSSITKQCPEQDRGYDMKTCLVAVCVCLLGVASDVEAQSCSGANLALGKAVSASRINHPELPENQPENAVDGDYGTPWNAGDYPPQWIEIDLGSPASLSCARLVVDQSPDGVSSHTIIGRTEQGQERVLASINQWLNKYEILEIDLDSASDHYQWVRVETTSSPSWVAWFEIELYGSIAVPAENMTWGRIKGMY
jgi:hypothetical protein